MISRRGILLLETGVTITITAVLLYGAVLLFANFQRIDRTARERVQTSRELARLAEQFRRDVYAAREAEPTEDKPDKAADAKLLLRLSAADDGRVEYHVRQGQLVRSLAKADKIVEREVFDLGANARFSIDVERDGASLVTLVATLSRGADVESNAPKTERRVTALLSRDHRYDADLKKGSEQ